MQGDVPTENDRVKRVHSFRWVVLTSLAALLVVFGGAGIGCGRPAVDSLAAENRTPVQVQVAAATMAPVDVVYEAVGTVQSKTNAVISSKITGHVVAVHAQEGDIVVKDALLLEIDNRDAASMLAQAEAALQESENALQETEQGVSGARAGLSAAEANRDVARSTFQRYTALVEEQVVGKQAFDEVEGKHKAAEAAVQQASDAVQSALSRKLQALSRVEQAKSARDQARVNLTYTKISAPFNGVVTMKQVDVGDLASPGSVLFELKDNIHYRLEVIVDESRAGSIHQGDAAEVLLEAMEPDTLSVPVSEIAPSTDPVSRSFIVKLDLPERDGLRSGMYGTARFKAAARPTLTVAISALVERGQLLSVFVVDAEKVAHMRLVKSGKRYGDRIEILSGLTEGELVVTQGLERIRDGSAVAY